MKQQNYHHYKRSYTPHHFIFLPLLLILEGVGIQKVFSDKNHSLEWILFSVCIFCILYLTIMLRQHYALGNQDRIVRLEFRLRYYELFGERSKPVEEKLNFPQIAALRFASDEEFPELLHRALTENLPGEKILKSIQHWQPDYERV
jgi:Family of unknown function (DUF6526)